MGERRSAVGEPVLGVREMSVHAVRHVAIWKAPRSSRALILSVETLCVTWLLLANIFSGPTAPDFGRFALLSAVTLAYAEGNARIERLSRFVGSTQSRVLVNAASLWCFAAALTLPIGLAGGFAVLIYAQSLLTAHKIKVGQPFRIIYTGSTEVAATMAAAAVVAAFGRSVVFSATPLSLVAVVAAIATYTLVNQVLIVSAVYLTRRPVPLRSLIGDADAQLMEFATLALGVLFAIAIIYAPYLSPFSLILIVVLRRSSLVRQLQEQATRDGKTGLLNASAWRQVAERELVRAERVGGLMSVVMIDLDHFKMLNDQYGHQAGDVALKAVADCLYDALRGYDAVGRFGGEEFIALLMDVDATASGVVAERLRARIAALHLPQSGPITASVGVGVGAANVNALDELISVADKALYVAKRSGRNRVHISQAQAPEASVR